MSFENETVEIKTKLEKNRRQTIQKIKIGKYLAGVKTHPTAERVYIEVKRELPSITLATVYRNLNQMAEDGEIVRLELNKEYHYDAEISSHQHFLCLDCKKITDICDLDISKKISASLNDYLFRNNKKTEISSISIVIRGLCPDCKN
ncbi:transcriptional repressor [Candidatus Woesearchaeota archaeon]|nr:transcriptional repressor [Candidatus Woesearchaeota archaeon]